mgnify:CR=1 FL=1
MTDISTMQRKAYDGAAYERETVGAEGVNVHIPQLLWNTVFAGTNDALHRMVPNVTDGSCSRLCVASTPDNTFAHIEVVKPLNEAQRAHIQQVARLLTLMGGTVELPALEKTAMEWTENLRSEAEAEQDKRDNAGKNRQVCYATECYLRIHIRHLRFQIDHSSYSVLPQPQGNET